MKPIETKNDYPALAALDDLRRRERSIGAEEEAYEAQ